MRNFHFQIIFFFIINISFCFSTFADSWVTVTSKTAVSDDGNLLVRVEPGDSWGDLVGFQGANIDKYARASYYRRDETKDIYEKYLEIGLPNPVAPDDILINNEGILVTLDNWHNAGYGKIVVIYDINGEIIRSYELADLYSEETIQKIVHSVSSIWWRCTTTNPIINSRIAWISDSLGGHFEFDLEGGTFTYVQESGECPHTG